MFQELKNISVNNEITKICIIATEPSGDVLASKLIAELKAIFPLANYSGVGGNLMIDQGFSSIFPMEDLALMGIVEILPHLPKILKRISQTVNYIKEYNPQIVISVDSPDFSFRVIKKIQNIKSIKKVHLIAPSVWAYREGRAKKISKIYDLLLAILPFEPPYFEKYGLKTIFIGHPIIEKNPDFSNANLIKENFRSINKISSDDFLLCLTPGSRNSEVKKIFPEMIKAVNELYQEKTNLKIAIPIVKKTQDLVRSLSNKINAPHFIIEDQEQKNSLYLSCDFAIAKSGTNTVEFSLYKIPIIICYKVNLLTYLILKTLIKIKYANLLNLILNREIIPELLQNDCNSQNIHKELKRFIDDKNLSLKQINDTQKALEMIGLNSNISASKKACNAIFDLLKK